MSLLLNQAIMSASGLVGIISLIIGVRSTVLAIKDSDNDDMSKRTLTAVCATGIAAAAVTGILMYLILK